MFTKKVFLSCWVFIFLATSIDATDTSPGPSSVNVPHSSGDVLFLEKIINKLLSMTNYNCNTLINQTFSKVNTIPPKPDKYPNYIPAKTYELRIKQIAESFKDLKGRVSKEISMAKDPANKVDLMRIFEKIYGDIDLHSRKNCEKYTSFMNNELDTQLHNINEFNKKNKTSFFSAFKRSNK